MDALGSLRSWFMAMGVCGCAFTGCSRTEGWLVFDITELR